MTQMTYERPTELARVCELLTAGGAEVLAGGTDLLVHLRDGRKRPAHLVDIKALPGIHDLSFEPSGAVLIGAAVTLRAVSEHPELLARFPALCAGAEAVGSLQIRVRATIGGNLCNASPCMDTAPPLLVLGARVHLAGPEGLRVLPLSEFFLGPKRTALKPGEILYRVELPPEAGRLTASFDKVKRVRGHDLALVNAAVSWDQGAGILRAAVGSCGPTPVYTGEVAALATPEASAAALASAARDRICPIDDVRATAEYRQDLTTLLCRRMALELMGATEGR